MIFPSFFKSTNIFVTEWASICNAWGFHLFAYVVTHMLIVNIFVNHFFAIFALLELCPFRTLFLKMVCQRWYFNYLPTPWTVAQHQAMVQIMVIQVFRYSKLGTFQSTKLALWLLLILDRLYSIETCFLISLYWWLNLSWLLQICFLLQILFLFLSSGHQIWSPSKFTTSTICICFICCFDLIVT